MILLRKSLAEMIGTFALVFVGCGAIRVQTQFPEAMPALAIPIIFGLVVAAMIYAVGHISGAHFNPAVTLGFSIARHFPVREVLAYWVAQFGGAFLAIFALSILLPEGSSFGATIPHLSLSLAIGWEFILTFFLMFVITAVATDTRAMGVMAGTAIGMTVMIGALIGGPLTGASMNPARSLAPAVWQGQLSQVWIYFVGPILGSLAASFVYEWIRCVPGISGREKLIEDALEHRKSAKGCC